MVVGAGLTGRWHAHAIARAGSQVEVVVDPQLDRARALAVRHPGARAISREEAASAYAGVDVVHLCTPSATHAALAEEAIRAGRHLLVEKPLAESSAATAGLFRLAEAHGVLLCPVHQFLFQAGVRRALDALPAIGPLRHVDAIVCSAGAAGGSERRMDEVALEILPHPLSLLARLLPSPISELRWEVLRPGAGELRAAALAGDVSVGILISMRGRPTTNSLRLIGEGGTAHADLFHGFGVVEPGAVSRAHKILHPFALSTRTLTAATGNLARRVLRDEPAYPGLRELVRGFHAAARGEGPPPIEPREATEVALAQEALASRMHEKLALVNGASRP